MNPNRKVKKSESEKIAALDSVNTAMITSLKAKVLLQKMHRDTEPVVTAYKESLVAAYNELAEHYYATNNLTEARACYNLILESNASREKMFEACMKGVLVSMDMWLPKLVISYQVKARHFLDDSDQAAVSKLLCAAGVAHMRLKHYKVAACKFLAVVPGTSYSELLSPQDIAIYGTLCALATFDELELKDKVIHNTSFQQFVARVPQIKGLIEDFSSSRLEPSLECLRRCRPSFLLDIHLSDHFDDICILIRRRALIPYAQIYKLPFVTVDLASIAKAFGTTTEDLDHELQQLFLI